jgi:pimeloyl-ACP methyl ester carboxylesterase
MTPCGRVAAHILLLLVNAPLFSQSTNDWKDRSPHITRFVSVENTVKLEVLDWGGSGRPIVLLAGGGNTAHVFDDFAPKLTDRYHVFGVTRRGFGASGYSNTEAPADRLAEDVLAVIDTLKLRRPILVGHSIAGAELSWIANNHPDRVAGLIYLDGAYSYAFDDGKGTSVIAAQALKAPQPPPPTSADLASFDALGSYYERVNGFRFPEAELRQQRESTPEGAVGKYRDVPGGAMLMSLITNPKKYADIPPPALIIFANPHSQGTWVDNSTDPSIRAAAESYSNALTPLTEKQKKAVQDGVPTARVITLQNAHHYVFLSNETKVLQEMRIFLAGLPADSPRSADNTSVQQHPSCFSNDATLGSFAPDCPKLNDLALKAVIPS